MSMRVFSSHTTSSAAGRRALTFAALLLAALCAVAVSWAASAPAQTPREKLEATQDKLEGVQAHSSALAETIAEQNRVIDSMIGEVSALRQKQAAVEAELAEKQAQLEGATAALDKEKEHLEAVRDQLNRTYQPNPVKPLFNHMWDGYVSGKIDLDFRAGLAQIDRIDELSDKRFLALLKPYVEARYKQPGFRPAGLDTEEKFLAKALARKQSLRGDMTRFYDSLAKERGLSGLQEAMTRHRNAAPAMVVRVS